MNRHLDSSSHYQRWTLVLFLVVFATQTKSWAQKTTTTNSKNKIVKKVAATKSTAAKNIATQKKKIIRGLASKTPTTSKTIKPKKIIPPKVIAAKPKTNIPSPLKLKTVPIMPIPISSPTPIVSEGDLPLITSDIYVLEKVTLPNGHIRKLSDQQSVGRFITFSSFSSLSGFDGCSWFQHQYLLKQSIVQVTRKRSMASECDKNQFTETLPSGPFMIHYEAPQEMLILSSPSSKQKFYYRKSGSH